MDKLTITQNGFTPVEEQGLIYETKKAKKSGRRFRNVAALLKNLRD